jgi:prolyl-tRNA editing enzyme YbaK/EbsC (Cys-tRNA(Pro) deacylase)
VPPVHPTALKVAERLHAAGLDVDVQELDASTRTAEEAAAAAGCELGQIVKVRDATGFAIGGVPPLGHVRPVRTLVDESLRRFTTVWCAAGTPRAVFEVETERLIAAIPGAEVRAVTG